MSEMACDRASVQLKHQNSEGVVHVYEVDDYGQASHAITVEPISWYRHKEFALDPTYVCDCGSEYSSWADVEYHLEVMGE